MTDLSAHLRDYLRLRRAFGFKLEYPGHVLPQFLAYLDAKEMGHITAAVAIEWAGLSRDALPVHRAHRLGAVRGFARYMAAIDPATEVPPAGVWSTRTPRRNPFVFSDADISHLLEGARALRPPLRGAALEALLGLLASTGMRVGEALGLERSDVDLDQGVIEIREAKFDRSRLVPLHASTTAALAAYRALLDREVPERDPGHFFLTGGGRALRHREASTAFVEVTAMLGLRDGPVLPRIHDLRHRFAITTLLEWHRAGMRPPNQLALLSTFLGHLDPSGTYWYLTATPELIELVAARVVGGPK